MTRIADLTGFVILALFGAGLAVPAASARSAAPPPSVRHAPHAVDQLIPGLWEFRDIGANGTAPLRLCVRDLRLLLQPLQTLPLCGQFLADEGPDHVTASYDCGTRGQGRTAIRIETSHLIQIDSQGVANARPFAVRLEGRWVGACPSAAIEP